MQVKLLKEIMYADWKVGDIKTTNVLGEIEYTLITPECDPKNPETWQDALIAPDQILALIRLGFLTEIRKRKITKPRWKPEVGEEYYTVNLSYETTDKDYNTDCFDWDDDDVDNFRYKIGLVFKTEKEALKAHKTIIALWKDYLKNNEE